MKLYRNPSVELMLLEENDIVRTSTGLDIKDRFEDIDQEIDHGNA